VHQYAAKAEMFIQAHCTNKAEYGNPTIAHNEQYTKQYTAVYTRKAQSDSSISMCKPGASPARDSKKFFLIFSGGPLLVGGLGPGPLGPPPKSGPGAMASCQPG